MATFYGGSVISRLVLPSGGPTLLWAVWDRAPQACNGTIKENIAVVDNESLIMRQLTRKEYIAPLLLYRNVKGIIMQ